MKSKRLVVVNSGIGKKGEISLAWVAKDELKKLKQTLEMIDAVTSDAETRQVQDAAVKLWLRRLKEAAYDADDVLDEFSYKVMRRSETDRKREKVRDFISSSNPIIFHIKMAHRIKEINVKLDKISRDMVKFQFQPTSVSSCIRDRLTSHYVDEVKIVGRETDKINIVKMLMAGPSSTCVDLNQQEKVSVISIVGMGGLGKTALAQSIYNQKSIEQHFSLRMWVCVSNEFDVYNILRNIMESITNSKCQNFSNVDLLVKHVTEQLKGKKYLLVLDDLWNEDPMKWNTLKSFLDIGTVGSKIIVTTRNQKVASVVRGSISPYNLSKLSELQCWSIIRRIAFSPGGAWETPKMKNIGEKIAKKCGGLPLAANFFGCHMHSQSNEKNWLSIRDNNSLETPENQSGGIIPILKLSYDNLPSHLKQCFSYCCIFPKDWKYNTDTLIQLWMAEGFLHPSSGENEYSLGDIGNDYFHSLLSSSFFQDVEKDELGDIITFKMHDLVHDLAQSVVGPHEVTILNASGMDSKSEVRRLQIMLQKGNSETLANFLNGAKELRTIVCQEKDILEVPVSLCNKRLRVLYLAGVHSLKIPSSSFKFRHLRYLDLTSSSVEKVHAASISQLYNLQTLNLSRCQNVHKILTEIGSLKSLSHLNLSRSDVKVLPSSIFRLTNLQNLDISLCDISVLPTNIGSLRRLSSLDISHTSIAEIPDSITEIRTLRSFNFIVCKGIKVLPSGLGVLTQLRSLDMLGTEIRELPDSFSSNLCSLELVDLGYQCKYPKDIKSWVELRILRYSGRVYDAVMPTGMKMLTRLEELSPYLVRKEEFSFGTDSNSTVIEELAELNSLQVLNIKHLHNVRDKLDAEKAKLKDKRNIRSLRLSWETNAHERFVEKRFEDDEEEYKEEEDEEEQAENSVLVLEGLKPHPNLREMTISYFKGYKFPQWMTCSLSNCLPNLVILCIKNCFNCEKLPALGMLPCLKTLLITGLHSVKCLGKEFYYLHNEEEENSSSSTTTLLFPSLEYMSIGDMPSLEEWITPPQPYSFFPSLEYLDFHGGSKLTSIPDLRSWTSLRTLKIICHGKLKESISYDLKKSLTFLEILSVDYL